MTDRLASLFILLSSPVWAAPSGEYPTKIRPLLEQHCIRCHGPEKQKGKLRLDTLSPDFSGPAAETWHDVLENLNLGEMPPEEETQPNREQRRLLTSWIRSGLKEAARERNGAHGQIVLRRLTRYEYHNTLRDLLGLEMDFARDLPPEPSSEDGFKNNGHALGISPLQIEYYLKSARRALDKAIVTGPAPEVFEHRFTNSSQGNQRRQQVVPGNHMRPGGRFFGKMQTFPHEGEFRIRLKAGATVPEGMGYPRMRVSIGMRSDTQSPTKVVGEVDVTADTSDPRVYELRGRIEEFPLPGHNPKFPGLTITVANVYDDGLPPDKPYQFKAIPIPGPQKKELGKAVKAHRPSLPLEKTVLKKNNKALRGVTKFIDGLQKKMEELNVLDPEDENQVDLAFRLFDLQNQRNKLRAQIKTAARQLKQDDHEAFWAAFESHNQNALARHESILKRFAHIEPIDRKDKARLQALMPKQAERSTVILESLEFTGPYFHSWPPASHQRLLPEMEGDDRARAKGALQQFITRAYRRPATKEDLAVILSFYDEVRPLSSSFEEAMRECFAMVLVSPEFLYLVEPAPSHEQRDLTQHELATRLSYFLWSTTPEDELLSQATSGELKDSKIIAERTRKMIADARSKQFVRHFTDQWLDLSGIDRVAINPEYYPKFDDSLKPMMREETQRFFAEILHKDLSALNLIDSDFVMLNERLARHYGLSGPQSGAFERVSLKAQDRRGGILTQAGILLLNSTGEDSHPVRRAVWVRDRLLNDPPADPPADVPGLESDEPNFKKLSVRRQLEVHRKKEACADCHRGIDPWGIPFEGFDAVGQWREKVLRTPSGRRGNGVTAPVEDVATLPNGTTVQGVEELKKYLLTHERRRFAKALTSKLLSYSLGRSLTFADDAEVESLTDQFEKSEYRLSELIVAIVHSKTFQRK